MISSVTIDWLDIVTTILGLIYIWLEYRAHIALWAVGIVMTTLDVYLYYRHGLYGDAGLSAYYTLTAVYGLMVWTRKARTQPLHDEEEAAVSRMPRRLFLPTAFFFSLAWAATYYILIRWTNSTVPLLDSFTNALSFVGLWALSRKYLEHWCCWIVVDAVCCALYMVKDLPFKAGLYGLYVVIVVMGYFKWKKMIPRKPTVT